MFALDDIVADAFSAYQKQVLQAAMTSVVAVTIPNNVQQAQKIGKHPGKKATGALRTKIKHSIIPREGEFATAVPNKHGDPVNLKGFGPNGTFVNNPLGFVLKRGRSKYRANVFTPTRDWIIAHTELKIQKKITQRVPVGGTLPRLQFVDKNVWRAVANDFAKYAGRFIGGWNEAAEMVGSAAVNKALASDFPLAARGGRASRPQSHPNGEMVWEATNTQAPNRHLADYVRGYLKSRLSNELAYYADTFRKYYLQSIRKNTRNLDYDLCPF